MELTAEAVLLDLDGTLVDSTASIVAGLVPAHDAGAALGRIDELELADAGSVTTMPGALDLVAALPAGRFAYVTSANARLAAARLTAAGLTFDPPLITADDVVRGKPDPEPYLLGASRLGIDPANCVVFEDAPSGIASARTAGMGVIGITSTHAAGELAADVVVASPATVTVRGTGPILIGMRR